MKRKPTSQPFDDEQMAEALAAAQDAPIQDAENPPTVADDWDNAVVSNSLPELREQIRRCGPQKKPLKVPTTIRLDSDVVEKLKAGGKGWQTRVNDALRELVESGRLQ